MRKTVNLTLVAEYTPEPDPPEANAYLSLLQASYTFPELVNAGIAVQRSVRTDQVIECDWAVINASVSPVSGTLRWELGEVYKSINFSTLEVDSNELGTIELSNPQYISGPFSEPLLGNIPIASIAVEDTDTDPIYDIGPYTDPLDGVSITSGRNEVFVTSDAQFTTALANAQPGDTILLNANTFTATQTATAIGTPTQPIIIKGAANFGTKFDGVLRLRGQYTYVIGLDCSTGSSGRISVSGYINKVLGCKFEGFEGTSPIGVDRERNYPGDTGGRYGEVAYCDFGPQGSWPDYPDPNNPPDKPFRQQIKMFTDGDAGGWDSVHTALWVHHNNFHDSIPRPTPDYDSGDADIMETGESDETWTYNLFTGWYVEYNIFQNNNNAGNTLIDFKTRGHVCRGNTCINNASNDFWSRTGGAITYASNWMDDAWGAPAFVLRDSNNIVVNNYMVNGNIWDYAGDRPYDTSRDDFPQAGYGQYPAAFNSKIMSNTGVSLSIVVGQYFSSQSGTPLDYEAENTLIEDQATDSITFKLNAGVPQYLNPIDNRNAPPSITAADPVQLSDTDVGPAAMDNASSAWKQARLQSQPWANWIPGIWQKTFIPSHETYIGMPLPLHAHGVGSGQLGSWAEWESGLGASWGDVQWALAYLQTQGRFDTPFVMIYGMLPDITGTVGTIDSVSNKDSRDPTTWDRAANGDYDAHVHAFAQNLRTGLASYGRDPDGLNFIIDLGWEMTGAWYDWAITTPSGDDKVSEYRATWNNWTTIIKSYLPKVKFSWRSARAKVRLGGSDVDFVDLVPTQNADYLSLSHHDQTHWNGSTYLGAYAQPDKSTWTAYQVNDPNTYNLSDLEAAGRALNKLICLGESRPQIANCDSWWTASPYPHLFIQYTHEWIESVSDIFLYEVYLNSSCSALTRVDWSSAVTSPSSIDAQANWALVQDKYEELYFPQLAKVKSEWGL